MITPREAILTVLQDVLHGSAPSTPGASPAGNRITWETVQAVSATGQHTVLGVALPVTGLRVFPVGARVPVAWRNGAPVVIIGHRARRAQFHPSYRRTTAGIVEELFVANQDGAGVDVWYRNSEKAQSLLVTRYLGGQTPTVVKWGMDGRSFAVACTGGYYATFSLSRADANAVSDDDPGTAALLWLGRPADIDVPMVTTSFGKTLSKTVIEWLGLYDTQTGYYENSTGGMYYWSGFLQVNHEGWEGADPEGDGSVSTSTPKAFGLAGLLANSILDWDGNALTTITEMDWYLDADRLLKFLYRVDWSYFVLGDSGADTGSVVWPNGQGTDTLTLTGTSTGVLGAKKQSDMSIVPESHLFLVVPQTASVEWATCPAEPAFTEANKEFAGRLLEHDMHLNPSYPGGLSEPHLPEWDPPNPPGTPNSTDVYYGGAESGGGATYERDAGTVAEERTTVESSTATGQMFDPAKLAAIVGPFTADSGTTTERTSTIYGLGGAFYSLTYETLSGAIDRLWHYRVESAQVFSRRVEITLPGGAVIYQDEPLFFLTLERYPVIAGTGYINDIPEIWIGIVTKAGATVQVLRDWAYGLSSSASRLVSGNGHRVIWTLGTNWLSPTVQYVVTMIPSGFEAIFTTAQASAFLARQAKLYPPDFLWDHVAPEAFDLPASLPALTEDGDLAESAALQPVTGTPVGDVRMVNDAEILGPLGRWQGT